MPVSCAMESRGQSASWRPDWSSKKATAPCSNSVPTIPFVGMPSPPAAGVIAATVYLYPYGLQDRETALPALAMVLVPAFLMVSTFRFRSIKAIDVGWRRSYFVLFLSAVGLALIATHPRLALVGLAYTYLASAFIGLAYARLRPRKPAETPAVEP